MGAGAFCLILWNAARLGVWEPWEAEAANVVRNMLSTGNLLSVNVGTIDAPESLANLPFGWWPQVISYWILGESEFALRLPNVLISSMVIASIYWVTHTYYNREVARLSGLTALCIPLLVFNGGLALGSAMSQGCVALACLWMLIGHANHWRQQWFTLGTWIWILAAGLSAGIVGLLLPLVVFLSCGGYQRWRPLVMSMKAMPLAGVLILLISGWWFASAYCPENLPKIQWLWFIDGLAIERMSGFHPAFSLYVHQIGFGLFPWGALAPLAFGLLLFGKGLFGVKRRFLVAVFVWFAGAFAYGAMTYSWTHYALFLGAPALALIIGPFLYQLSKTVVQMAL